MQNYKVEVKNHGESIEAQELFFNLGYSWFHKKFEAIEIKTPETIMCFENGALTTGIRGSAKHKQITLPELRDMVVLKKNDIGDATHENTVTGSKVYVGANSKYYFQDGIWNEYPCGVDIKPIQKEELKMKEYLVKTDTGYTLQVLSDVIDGHDGIIEVPEGAEILTACGLALYFWNKTNNTTWVDGEGWVSCDDERLCTLKSYLSDKDATIIWNRESLNDQVASAEEYRKSFSGIPKATLDAMNNIQNAFDKAQCAINAQNAMAKLFTYPQYLSGVVHGKEFIVKLNQKKDESKLFDTGKFILEYFTQPEELPFVGDTQQTLNERQSQYGDFKDVAEMTQGLLFVMEQYGYEDMPDIHKEAIHMICSKMARIVNGDHNHIDSWHDIGGYAKLIENNIK